jgi:hypothetical protein
MEIKTDTASGLLMPAWTDEIDPYLKLVTK